MTCRLVRPVRPPISVGMLAGTEGKESCLQHYWSAQCTQLAHIGDSQRGNASKSVTLHPGPCAKSHVLVPTSRGKGRLPVAVRRLEYAPQPAELDRIRDRLGVLGVAVGEVRGDCAEHRVARRTWIRLRVGRRVEGVLRDALLSVRRERVR